MQLGAMNNPAKGVYDEVSWIAERFDFVDLTLEPPGADASKINVERLVSALKGKKVVGHTAWYLPFASPYPAVRKSALDELLKCLDVFRQLDCRLMNVHIGSVHRFFSSDALPWYAELLKRLAEEAGKSGIGVMVEHQNASPQQMELLEGILREVPEVKFHLDVGHANIGSASLSDSLSWMLKRFGKRLAHVHISDNNSKEDLHLPLGAGTINFSHVARLLRGKYDGTITLEVFSREEDYLLLSAKKFREWWKKGAAEE